MPELYESDFELGAVRRLAVFAPLRALLYGLFVARLGLLRDGFGLVGTAGAAPATRVQHDAWLRVREHARVLAHDLRTLSRESLASRRLPRRLRTARQRSASHQVLGLSARVRPSIGASLFEFPCG